ncbi:hypothetical protein T12_2879 [Trichinella patagoniensis]|uniref:Uncharacterized protein n=1 Tax=Trichinella patagoniensis TaxID=990121 RepID=A0A0V0ZI93_9BILA|nr:hypothetical protein T12_2879 [Trichinella patagoniensis]
MDTKRLGMTSPTNIWLAGSTILCTDDFCEPLTSAKQPRKSKALPLADNCHHVQKYKHQALYKCRIESQRSITSSHCRATYVQQQQQQQQQQKHCPNSWTYNQ